MVVLREGLAGSEGAKLQAQLQDIGFNPDPIDGRFGPATEAAGLAFQKSAELLADGIAGPHHIVQEVFEEAPQDVPPPAPCARRKRVASVFCASWCLLRHWWPTLSHRPPEMHAIDYLAREHPRAFV